MVKGEFSNMIKINDVEARFYLVKQDDKYFVSLIPKRSETQEIKANIAIKNKSEIKIEPKKIRVRNAIKIKH